MKEKGTIAMAMFRIQHLASLALTLGVFTMTSTASGQLFGRTLPGPDGQLTNVRAANMKFVSEMHDFGVVPDTNQIVWHFEFTNVGNDMLIISEVESTCGCTVPELKVRDYLPGESGSIEVRFEPKDRPGKNQKFITISSNDVSTIDGKRKIGFNAEVYQAVKLSTPALSIGRLIYGRGGQGEMTLTSKRSTFDIKKIDITGTYVTGEVTKREDITDEHGDPAHAITVQFKIDPAAHMGYIDRQVMFTTLLSKEDSAETIEHLVRFSVSARIAGQLQATPDRLTFGTPSAGSAIDREVRIVNLAGNPFNITNVRIETESEVSLSVAHDTVEVSGQSIPRIRVTGNAPENRGSFNGSIWVTTDLPNEAELEIKFFGSVRAGNRGPIVVPAKKDGDSATSPKADEKAAGDDR